MADYTIDEVEIPPSLAEDHDGVFAGMMVVRNAVEVAGYGIPEVAVSAEEMLPHYLDENEPKRVLVARVDGRIVARAVLEMQRDQAEVGWLDVKVMPGFDRRGIGTALADRIEAISRELGHTRVISYIVSPDGSGPRLEAPTGFGSVPALNREVRFLLARGWTLEQVERASRLALPTAPGVLAARREAAEQHADGYRLFSWPGATPPELLEGLAILQTRMSTDAPSAGLDEPPDIWTAERFAAKEALFLEAQQLVTTAAVHEATGDVAGFTRLSVPHDTGKAVGQWETIVLREHRGHRLGMLLKTANLQLLEEEAPGHPSVLTWNAEENRPMLDVNEAVGFVPMGYEGAWKKTF